MKDEKFKSLLKNARLEEPGPSFTDDLMIKVETREYLSISPGIQHLLQATMLKEPSENFTEKLLVRIPLAGPEFSDPVISRKIFIVLAGIIVMMAIVGIVVFRAPEYPVLPAIEKREIYTWIQQGIEFFSNSQTVFVCLIATTLLLLSDYFFWRRFRKITG